VDAALLAYYRCQDTCANFGLNGPLSNDSGFFRWGTDTVCYGRSTSGSLAACSDANLYDTQADVALLESCAHLPFDPSEIIENLLRERYSAHFRESGSFANELMRRTYYSLRPYLTVPIRKHLQRLRLRNWNKIPFPEWPIDITVDRIHRRLLGLAMRAQGIVSMPFVWFWPDNFTNCAIITHDVEHYRGRDFCGQLMDLDESFGFRSSFQVVPESRYSVSKAYLSSITDRGFEVNVHDLKHDGRLYAEPDEFLRRAQRINEHAREFGACGFRSGILYRNADWYEALDFVYDMSIPNVAHLDPQRGGCCTVMPYFIGKMVELPVTLTQDYTMFHMLGDYSIDLWKRQIELIRENHGLVSVLVHPDYVMEERAQNTYKDLLKYLSDLREWDHMWSPLPKEVAFWWKQRSEMKLVCEQGAWRVEGPGSERASVAYAHVAEQGVIYSLQNEMIKTAN
jgi:hypothetical protein